MISRSLVSLLPLLLLLLLSPCLLADDDCIPYVAPDDGGLCAPVFPEGTYVRPEISSATPAASILLGESLILELGFGNLTAVGGKVDPICSEVGLVYACLRTFKVCRENDTMTYVPRPNCKSVCSNFVTECADLLHATHNEGLIPTCPTTEEPECMSVPYSDALSEEFQCPEPLIRNPDPAANNSNCVGHCCVPCPQTHYFYPTGIVQRIDHTVQSLAVISLACALIVILSYTLMPEKRSYPSVIILCMAVSMIFIYFPVLFLLGDPNRVRCIDSVTQSVPGHNTNPICLFQATFLIYGYLSLVMWFLVLVCNIYSSVIFLSKRFKDFQWYFQGLCWGIPWIFVIVAHAMNKTGYAFGISCVIETGTFMNALLLGPIAAMIFPAVLLNLHVLVKIAVVAKKRNASLQAILALQIRSFFFVTTGLMVFLFYWIFVEVDVAPLVLDSTAPWVSDWFFCVATGQGQDRCSELAVGKVPLLAPFAIAEILVYSLGLVLLGFFILKEDVLKFWKVLLSGNTKRIWDPAESSLGHTKGSSHNKSGKDEEKRISEMQKSASAHSMKKMDDDLD